MIEALFAPGSQPFAIALAVMLGLLVVELLVLLFGGGASDAIDEFVIGNLDTGDFDASTGMEATGSADAGSMLGRFLSWLYVGKVPILMLLITFLAIFGLTGLILQTVAMNLVGFSVPALLAAPAVFVASLPMLRACGGVLAKIIPRDETSAVDPSEFVGHTALLVGGNAREGMPAQARLTDRFGTDHYVMVEPDDADAALLNGSLALLVSQRDDGRFSAIASDNPALHDS